jgi:hypothetical protein
VTRLQDYGGAEAYCREPRVQSPGEPEARQTSRDLYLILLKVYLSSAG